MERITINGTVAQFSCKQTIPKELWDAKGNKAKGKEAREINLALDNWCILMKPHLTFTPR